MPAETIAIGDHGLARGIDTGFTNTYTDPCQRKRRKAARRSAKSRHDRKSRKRGSDNPLPATPICEHGQRDAKDRVGKCECYAAKEAKLRIAEVKLRFNGLK